MMRKRTLHTSIASFQAERAGILVSFSENRASVCESQTEGNGLAHRRRNEQDPRFSAGAHLSFNRHYTAYLKHCEKRKLNPVTEDAFIDVHNYIVNGLREWWYQKETGIYIVEEESS